jgi:hypothetical protein
MKTKRFFLFGLLAVLLALALVLAGCGGDDESDDTDTGKITEPTTGQQTISTPAGGISVTGLPQTAAPQTDENTGATFSITDGKFSFTLPESPTNPRAVTEILGNGCSASPEDALFVMVYGFNWEDENNWYSMRRESTTETGGEITGESNIVYIYASKDVTVTSPAEEYSNEYEGKTEIWRSDAVTITLKKGWNLVQTDTSITTSGNTTTNVSTAKIATKNVPWVLETYPKEGEYGGGGEH